MLLFLLVGVAACSTIPEKSAGLLGRPAPDARLMMLDGSETTLSAEKGRYVAVLFWATWCKHSKGAIADFEDLARGYRRRADVSFFAVSVDQNADFDVLKGRILSQELKSIIHVFSGNDIQDEAYQKFFGELVPMVVLIDPRGVVRYVGTSVSDIEDLLNERFAR
jgi:thiol-disulfide isomerase/thioredoxin